jgi:thiamine biosynthesis lipoprotein ApbE
MQDLDALGTTWCIEALGSIPLSKQTISSIKRHIYSFERRFSRFDISSEVARYDKNKSASDLIQMVEYGDLLATRSAGLFDVWQGNELAKLGYGPITQSGLDLGGLGKGWLIDELGNLLKSKGVPYFVINGGGDILVSSSSPIELMLQNPLEPGLALGSVFITNGALASSSNIKRKWSNGVHIPKASPSTVASFVTAPTALEADILATIALINLGKATEMSGPETKVMIVSKN